MRNDDDATKDSTSSEAGSLAALCDLLQVIAAQPVLTAVEYQSLSDTLELARTRLRDNCNSAK